MNFSVLDVIFFLLIILFVIRCYLRGFVGEVMSMAAIVLGFLAALFFFKNGAVFLRDKYFPNLNIVILEIMSFAALFLIVFIVLKLIEGLLKGVVEGIKFGNVDRFFGILFGLVEGLVVISLILFILQIQPLVDPESLLSDSIFARLLLPFIMGQETITSV